MKTKKKKKSGRPSSWDESFYSKIIRLARTGMKDMKIAEAIGKDYNTFKKWLKENEDLREALVTARSVNNADEDKPSFKDYVYGRLPEHLKPTWNSMVMLHQEPNALRRLEALTAKQGQVGRQHLFIHALIHCNFIVTRACQMVGITVREYESWKDDPDFLEIVDLMPEWEMDFYQEAFMDLVQMRDPGIVKFAVQAKLGKRGFSPKTTIQHEGTIEHEHSHIIDVSKLSLDRQRQLLEAIDQQEAETKALEAGDVIIDAIPTSNYVEQSC